MMKKLSVAIAAAALVATLSAAAGLSNQLAISRPLGKELTEMIVKPGHIALT